MTTPHKDALAKVRESIQNAILSKFESGRDTFLKEALQHLAQIEQS